MCYLVFGIPLWWCNVRLLVLFFLEKRFLNIVAEKHASNRKPLDFGFERSESAVVCWASSCKRGH